MKKDWQSFDALFMILLSSYHLFRSLRSINGFFTISLQSHLQSLLKIFSACYTTRATKSITRAHMKSAPALTCPFSPFSVEKEDVSNRFPLTRKQ